MTTQELDFALYYPAYTAALDGDVAAALMLGQIVYWYMPDAKGQSKLRVFRYGKWWLVKSFRHWEAELGFSQKQSGRCVRVLKQRGLIVTIIGKYKTETVTHIRLVGVDGKNTLESPEALFKIANEAFQNPVKGTPLTETTTETTTESEPASASHSPSPQPLSASPKTEQEEQTQDQNQTQDQTKKSQDLLEALHVSAGLAPEPVAQKQSKIVLHYQKCMSAKYGYQLPLNTKQRAQLKGLYKKLGVDTAPVMD